MVARRGPRPDRADQARPGAGRGRGRRVQHGARAPWCCCRRIPTSRPGGCARRCRPGRRGPSGWSSPTRWAGRGGPGRPTTRSGRPALVPARDYRGEADTFGNVLEVTVAAVADEIAAAADLVKGKSTGRPGGRGARARRPGHRRRTARGHGSSSGPPRRTCSGFGSADVPLARRTIRAFTGEPVDAARRPPRGGHGADRAGAAPQPAVAFRHPGVRGGPDRTAGRDARGLDRRPAAATGSPRSRSPAGSGAARCCGGHR